MALDLHDGLKYLMLAMESEGLADCVNVFELVNLNKKQVGQLIKYLQVYARALRASELDPLVVYANIINESV